MHIEIKNSLPPDENCLDDDLFEDGFLSVSVILSTDEASALSQFVRRLTIVELEAILKNKQAAKEIAKSSKKLELDRVSSFNI